MKPDIRQSPPCGRLLGRATIAAAAWLNSATAATRSLRRGAIEVSIVRNIPAWHVSRKYELSDQSHSDSDNSQIPEFSCCLAELGIIVLVRLVDGLSSLYAIRD